MIEEIQIIPVVETNEKTQSDNKYILRYLNLYHGKALQTNKVLYKNFVYARSKSEMKSDRVSREIKKLIKEYIGKNRQSFVVFFIDTDKFGREEKKTLDDLLLYCHENDFIPVLFSYEIEDAFGVNIINNSKNETAILFAKQHHNKSSFNIEKFKKSETFVRTNRGYSNFETVITSILQTIGLS